jgi:DAACS family dicarboxylate/amino acid:cation (Na+ or H+) symporter
MGSHRGMLIGLLGGALAGLAANHFARDTTLVRWSIDYVAGPIGQVFLRLLFMLVIPLLFSAIVLGDTDLELRHLGRLGARMLSLHRSRSR